MKVSVIIPLYNVSAYIESCLMSIMRQTYNDIECVIVDDGSTDDSISKCERMIANYNGTIQFVILRHAKNRGLSAARNSGLEAAKGDYIFFIDSDDEISPNCIETLVLPILKDGSIEMVQGCHVTIRYREGIDISNLYKRSNNRNIQEFRTNKDVRYSFFHRKGYLDIVAWNKLMKKDFLSGHGLTFEEGILWEDNMWFFFVLKYLNHLCLLPDNTYCYNVRPNSICTGISKKKKRYAWGHIYKTIVDNETQGDEIQELLFYLPKFCYYFVTEYKDEQYQYAFKAFRDTLTKNKGKYPRCYLFLLKFANVMAKTFSSRYLFVICFYLYIKITKGRRK